MAYIVGDAITLQASFTNSAGTATDPTDVTLQVKDPSGNTDLYTYSLAGLTKASTGVYTKSIALDEAGYWLYEWQGTGTIAKVDNGKIRVEAQLI